MEVPALDRAAQQPATHGDGKAAAIQAAGGGCGGAVTVRSRRTLPTLRSSRATVHHTPLIPAKAGNPELDLHTLWDCPGSPLSRGRAARRNPTGKKGEPARPVFSSVRSVSIVVEVLIVADAAATRRCRAFGTELQLLARLHRERIQAVPLSGMGTCVMRRNCGSGDGAVEWHHVTGAVA